MPFRQLRSRYAAFGHDLLMVPVAWLGAYWLRFNLEPIPAPYLGEGLRLLPFVWFAQGAMFWYFGLYRGIWRFASIPDLIRIVKAVAAGCAIALIVSFVLTRLEGVPRSVFVLDGGLLLLLLGGPRFLYRWIKDRHLYTVDGQRAIIIGAGRAGEMLVRDLLRDPTSPYRPVGFVDDDPKKNGKEIHGLRVLGSCEHIPKLAREHDVDRILIALPSASSQQLRRIVELCEASGVPFRALPRYQDLASGKISIQELREVTIDDLLGRAAVKLDWQAIAGGIRDRVVLVTGGGGSIGAELCRQIARHEPSRLVVFERSELNLFEIERELRARYSKLAFDCELGDVCDKAMVRKLFMQYAPEIVYHAAAYKHVPMLEDRARAAAINNILGTQVVADACDRAGCSTFVLISSDKAVNPTNVMGATKRVAEMYCQLVASRSKTRYITVRFGNVLGSSGSVVPLFREQIARGGPVMVTHPDVTRYFMTIPEACQLILQASVIGRGGEILVLDMGEPISIAYLAEQMIRLSGKTVGEDVEIIYTGLRPGEKLREELFHAAERFEKTSHPKILLADSRPVDGAVLSEAIARIERASENLDDKTIKRVLFELIPEYESAKNGSDKDKPSATIHKLKSSSKSSTGGSETETR